MVLKKRLGHSTALMSLAASANSVISFVIFVVLSRILSPSEIGLVAFALVLVEIGKIIVNAGFPQAIVRHDTWDEGYAATCFYLNLAFAAIVALVVFAILAPLSARYYQPEAGPILQVLAAIFFIEGVKAVHEGKLKREFNFRTIAIRTVVGGLVGGSVGIYLAFNGFGVWALVWQQLINHSIISLLTILSARWRPALTFSNEHFRQLMKFSTPLMMAQLIGNVSAKIFDLGIGLVIGPAALGFFRVGGRAVFIMQDVVLKPFEQTALSALARLNSLAQKAAGTVRLIRMSGYLTFPIFFGAAAIGPEFIIFAFGEKWETSGNLMTILALGAVPLVIGYQINAALTASGHSRTVMKLASFGFITNCVVAALAIPFGLFAAACGYAFRNYVTMFFKLYFFKKVFDVSISHVLMTSAPAFMGSLIMFCVVKLTNIALIGHLSAGINLISLSILGIFLYALLMVTIFRSETRNFFYEGMDLAPEKFKPALTTVQRLLRLDR